jgi:large subunit ribosomal protein L17
MRHRKAGIKLNRTASHRNAMFKNMVTSLFKYDRIKTTDVKAKELRKWADNIITLAKKGDLHARRQALSIMMEKDIVHKLFQEVGERFGNVNGGYTRITKLDRRPGDAAPISLIELISAKTLVVGKKDKKGKKEILQKAADVKSVITKKTDTDKTEAVKADAIEAKTSEADETGETKAAIETSDKQETVAPATDDEDMDKKPE